MNKQLKSIFDFCLLRATGFCLLVSLNQLYAQLPPTLDSNWLLNVQLSDEFNNLDLTKWNVIEPYECCNWGGQSRFIAENVSISNGELVLEADPPTTYANAPSGMYSYFLVIDGIPNDSKQLIVQNQ